MVTHPAVVDYPLNSLVSHPLKLLRITKREKHDCEQSWMHAPRLR